MDIHEWLCICHVPQISQKLYEFRKATEEFGIPSRVRSDKGGENILVSLHDCTSWSCMVEEAILLVRLCTIST